MDDAALKAAVEPLVDELIKTAWKWGESCGVDDISSMEMRGDSYNEWWRDKTKKAREALLSALPTRDISSQGSGDTCADTRLRDAAADLLEGLKRARNICADAYKDTGMEWDEEAMAFFDAAIAKATDPSA